MLIQRNNMARVWAGVAASIAEMPCGGDPDCDQTDTTDVVVSAQATRDVPLPTRLDDDPPRGRPHLIAATLADMGLNLPVTRLAAHLEPSPVHLM